MFSIHCLSSMQIIKRVVQELIRCTRLTYFITCLSDHQNPGLFPAIYNKKDLSSKKQPLNHNHTHFLLVDEENKRKDVNTFRANLEKHFSESKP